MVEKEELLETVLSKIRESLSNGIFYDVEQTFIELKDLSSGNEWVSLKQTICAYLNTNGGYVICGVRERNKKYNLTGFDRNNESKLVELRSKFFKNGNEVLLDLSENISLDYGDVLGKTIAIISVSPLSEDLKYVKFEDVYYERVLTQDREIPSAKIRRHNEYKAELEYSKEISIVPNSVLEDLDVDKINQFIIRINSTGKKETVKKDLQDALDFLGRKYCIRGSSITTLGLLLFGKEPEVLLENRVRLDCYFETGDEIGRDKRYLENDILNLMDDAFSFVWNHIKVGRSFVGGGRSEPEFPQKLIREVVNNALAHRDYTINKFITIKINPGQSIQIANPGSFKQVMIVSNTSIPSSEVRRLVPGFPETKNPKLAYILKTFDKIESQGIGMATLVGVCLENKIDVPYYDLSKSETISITIPSGKLIDDETRYWLDSYNGYFTNKLNTNITIEHELVLAYLLKSERLNQKRFYTILLSPNNNHLDALQALRMAGLIYEHPQANTEQTPVFILNEELKKTDFTIEIERLLDQGSNLFKTKIKDFNDATKRVLNIIYRYNFYNDQSVIPSIITPELYLQLYGKEIEPTKYESLGRRVRKICGDLVRQGILQKLDDKSYRLPKKQVDGQTFIF